MSEISSNGIQIYFPWRMYTNTQYQKMQPEYAITNQQWKNATLKMSCLLDTNLRMIWSHILSGYCIKPIRHKPDVDKNTHSQMLHIDYTGAINFCCEVVRPAWGI